MGIFRAYFLDAATRRELKDHPLNGKTWVGVGGNIFVNGEFVRGTCTEVHVADRANLYHVAGERRVTAADFDRPVLVKMWFGPDWPAEIRRLLPE